MARGGADNSLMDIDALAAELDGSVAAADLIAVKTAPVVLREETAKSKANRKYKQRAAAARTSVKSELHKEGSGAVKMLHQMVEGLGIPANARDGDVVLDGHAYEVKSTKLQMIAQVRAVKFIPLIIYQSAREEWYVMPPQDVVRMVAQKTRGQHTEIPFECAAVNLNAAGTEGWHRWQKWRTRPEDMPAAMRRAWRSGRQHKDLHMLMLETEQRARALAEETRQHVHRLLGDEVPEASN